MHEGVPYGPVQGQGQGHVTLEILQFSKSISANFNMGAGK